MIQINTEAIILSRINYGEADRIITLLTPSQGKLSLMAKGVRKIRSKLAGGIELFSVSNISFVRGRGEVGTLISTRLVRYFSQIVKNVERVEIGYSLLKLTDRATEDFPEDDYFLLLESALESLDDASIDLNLIMTWFWAQLLKISGHTPNLTTTKQGEMLLPDKRYSFSLDDMAFVNQDDALVNSNDIKFLRLLFGSNKPKTLNRINQSADLSSEFRPLVQSMLTKYIRI